MAYAGRTCGDCKLFDFTQGTAGKCYWRFPECTGPKCREAWWCPHFTDQNGCQPLLECEEDELPEWTRSDQMDLFT